MAATFHIFNRLPPELRHRVWELSMTPRRVRRGSFSCQELPVPRPAPPPAVLHACVESRSYLERYYSKIFLRESEYIWVNYDLDTICLNEWSLEDLYDELPPIKHLSVYSVDKAEFDHIFIGDIERIPYLEDLEIRPYETGTYWWYGWECTLQCLYYTDTPVRFNTTRES